MTPESPRCSRLETLYQRFLTDQDSAAFVKQASLKYTCGALERLAENGTRMARRAAVLTLGFLGDYGSNSALGRALLDEDRGVRTLAENSLRSVWRRMGNDSHRQDLEVVIRLNTARRHREAIRRATGLIAKAPWFAEAWNQRAVAYYSLGRYGESIRDCHEALELNPYHFGAAAGMGQCYLQLGDQELALQSFRRALKLNQDLEGVRANVVYLERALKKKNT